MNKLLPILKIFAEFVLVLISFFIVLCVAYYFTWTLLVGPLNWGNDFPYIVSLVKYLDKWYPPIPNWNYEPSGGMPFLSPYPPLPALITFLYHVITGWSVVKTMRFLAWITVPIAACGVVVLGRLLTKNWFIGILAGVAMLFSPDTWIWMTVGGFYSFTLAVPIFTWSLVFFVLAFKLNKRFLWAIAIVFYGLTWVFHPMEAIMATIFFIIISIGLAKERNESYINGLIKAAFVILVGTLLSAWWIIPFYIVRQNGGIAAEGLAFVPGNVLAGLVSAKDAYVSSTFFTAGVEILFGIGIIAAFIRKSILRYIAIYCLSALFIVTCVGYLPKFMTDLLNLLLRSTNVRAAIGLRILGPIIAAHGAFSIARLIFWLIEKVVKNLSQNNLWKVLTAILCGVGSFFIFIFIVKSVIVKPQYPSEQTGHFYLGYGPMYNWEGVTEKDGVFYSGRGKLFPDIKEVILRVIRGRIEVDDSETPYYQLITEAIKKGELSNKDRIDIPILGGAYSYALNGASDIPQVPSVVGIRLITRMVGWQMYCFYLDSICKSSEVEDLSRWFGIKTIWLGLPGKLGERSEQSMSRIINSSIFDYQRLSLGVNGVEYGWDVYNFPQYTGLASITNKPTILVIGDNPPNNDVFDTIFRGLSIVNFGYENAWVVKGKRYVDDFKLSELQKFNLLILHGYRYHSRENAEKLLNDYVTSGGNIFINTGWQYMNDDWGKVAQNGKFEEIEMPGFLPISKTIWGSVGKNWNLILSENEITKDLTIGDWGNPVWNDLPWGMALSQNNWLRQGAMPIVVNNDKVLVAGWKQGKGKVVWTGFDFWGYVTGRRASGQELFVNRILHWLTDTSVVSTEQKLDFERVSPDLVKIKITPAASEMKLLFKEVNNSNWKAVLNSGSKTQSLKIYSAGPGWKMVFLPKISENSYITFQYQKVFSDYFAIAISILAFVAILIYMLGLHKGLVERFNKFTHKKITADTEKIKKAWEEE